MMFAATESSEIPSVDVDAGSISSLPNFLFGKRIGIFSLELFFLGFPEASIIRDL